MNLEKLKEPFAPSDVSWRIGQAGKTRDGKIWAKVLAYIDNRDIQERLDEVVGPENWKNEYAKGPEGGVLCGLSIRIDGEWVTKWDGAENSDIEPIKGGLSDAMKRAAVQWGIGRYLYDLGESWADVLDKKEKDAHYAHCKIKASGKEEWVDFYWHPPRNVFPGVEKAKQLAEQTGLKTADKLPAAEKTPFQKALDEISKAVRDHDLAHLTTVAKRIRKSVEQGSISAAEDVSLVNELAVAARKIEALKNEPDQAAA